LIWGPPAIAGFAQRAGFREELALAVALALAVSHGDDSYRWSYDVGRAVTDQRGLWGIDVMAHPEVADLDLFHPQQAADAALLLYRRGGGTWSWCPAWPPQTYRAWLGLGTEAAAHPTHGQVETGPGPGADNTGPRTRFTHGVDHALTMIDGASRMLRPPG
jgi:hypothetical protein